MKSYSNNKIDLSNPDIGNEVTNKDYHIQQVNSIAKWVGKQRKT